MLCRTVLGLKVQKSTRSSIQRRITDWPLLTVKYCKSANLPAVLCVSSLESNPAETFQLPRQTRRSGARNNINRETLNKRPSGSDH